MIWAFDGMIGFFSSSYFTQTMLLWSQSLYMSWLNSWRSSLLHGFEMILKCQMKRGSVMWETQTSLKKWAKSNSFLVIRQALWLKTKWNFDNFQLMERFIRIQILIFQLAKSFLIWIPIIVIKLKNSLSLFRFAIKWLLNRIKEILDINLQVLMK